MLEKQLSVLLATFLNQFICDLNEEQLQVSLWSGDLVLRDLRLRPNIIDQIALSLCHGGCGDAADAAKATAQAFAMPVTLLKGVVRELVISVPWAAVDREPISVEVRGVDIIFGPLRSRLYTSAEDVSRVFAVKQKQLKLFEMERLFHMRGNSEHELMGSNTGCSSLSLLEEKKKKTQGSYFDRLIETIKRNIFLVLRDVSLKYIVDYYGLAPCLTCALVFSLKTIYITTTDEEWENRFVLDLSMPYCKKIVAKKVKTISLRNKKHRSQREL